MPRFLILLLVNFGVFAFPQYGESGWKGGKFYSSGYYHCEGLMSATLGDSGADIDINTEYDYTQFYLNPGSINLKQVFLVLKKDKSEIQDHLLVRPGVIKVGRIVEGVKSAKTIPPAGRWRVATSDEIGKYIVPSLINQNSYPWEQISENEASYVSIFLASELLGDGTASFKIVGYKDTSPTLRWDIGTSMDEFVDQVELYIEETKQGNIGHESIFEYKNQISAEVSLPLKQRFLNSLADGLIIYYVWQGESSGE